MLQRQYYFYCVFRLIHECPKANAHSYLLMHACSQPLYMRNRLIRYMFHSGVSELEVLLDEINVPKITFLKNLGEKGTPHEAEEVCRRMDVNGKRGKRIPLSMVCVECEGNGAEARHMYHEHRYSHRRA